MAIIYKIENKLNGKVYIGQTKSSLEYRLNNSFCGHFHRAFIEHCNSAICRALRKYGKDNFTYDVLEETTENMLDEREMFYIQKYESYKTNKGYNRTLGGQETYSLSDEQKQRISDITKNAMSKYNTKELCNPKKYMTAEQIKEWKHKNAETSRIQIIEQWKDPIAREKLIKYRAGSKWMYKDSVSKFVRKDKQNEMLQQGWQYGKSELMRSHCGVNKGKRFMNNGIKECFVQKKDIQTMLDRGYVFGRLKKRGANG